MNASFPGIDTNENIPYSPLIPFSLSCDWLEYGWLVVLCDMAWVTFFVTPLTEPGLCIKHYFVLSAHMERTASKRDSCWIWQKVHRIRSDSRTLSKASPSYIQVSCIQVRERSCLWNHPAGLPVYSMKLFKYWDEVHQRIYTLCKSRFGGSCRRGWRACLLATEVHQTLQITEVFHFIQPFDWLRHLPGPLAHVAFGHLCLQTYPNISIYMHDHH